MALAPQVEANLQTASGLLEIESTLFESFVKTGEQMCGRNNNE
jgi:hypothetical protein